MIFKSAFLSLYVTVPILHYNFLFACQNNTGSAKRFIINQLELVSFCAALQYCDGSRRVFSQIDKICTFQQNLSRNTKDYIEKIPKLIWKAVLSNFSVFLWRKIYFFSVWSFDSREQWRWHARAMISLAPYCPIWFDIDMIWYDRIWYWHFFKHLGQLCPAAGSD